MGRPALTWDSTDSTTVLQSVLTLLQGGDLLYQGPTMSPKVLRIFLIFVILLCMISMCWTDSEVQSIEEAQDVGGTTVDEVVEEGSQVAPGMVDQLLRKLATLLA